jgi:phosphatidylglycerol:prolipoprotein diacylglycerol transferase
MEAGGEIVIFALLLIVRHYKRFSGQVIATYLMLYGVLRFAIEFFRGDMDRGFVIPDVISMSQAVSIGMILLGLIIYLWKFRGSER